MLLLPASIEWTTTRTQADVAADVRGLRVFAKDRESRAHRRSWRSGWLALISGWPLFVVLALWLASVAAAAAALDHALIAAVERGDDAEVQRLLTAGASVKARDPEGRTALVAATYANRPNIAKRLIEAGADVNAQDNIRNSAFLLAGARGHLEIVRLTLAAGADLKSTNRFGGTALIPACHYGHVETVRELLKTRIDVDHVNSLGWTALLEAVILGDGGPRHVQIVRLLVEHKAKVDLADRDGVTPLAHARNRGYTAIAAILEKAGAR